MKKKYLQNPPKNEAYLTMLIFRDLEVTLVQLDQQVFPEVL